MKTELMMEHVIASSLGQLAEAHVDNTPLHCQALPSKSVVDVADVFPDCHLFSDNELHAQRKELKGIGSMLFGALFLLCDMFVFNHLS